MASTLEAASKAPVVELMMHFAGLARRFRKTERCASDGGRVSSCTKVARVLLIYCWTRSFRSSISNGCIDGEIVTGTLEFDVKSGGIGRLHYPL